DDQLAVPFGWVDTHFVQRAGAQRRTGFRAVQLAGLQNQRCRLGLRRFTWRWSRQVRASDQREDQQRFTNPLHYGTLKDALTGCTADLGKWVRQNSEARRRASAEQPQQSPYRAPPIPPIFLRLTRSFPHENPG